MRNHRKVVLHRVRQFTFHALHVIDVVLEEQVVRTNFGNDVQSLFGAGQEEARDIKCVDRFDQQWDTFCFQFGSRILQVGNQGRFCLFMRDASRHDTGQDVDLFGAEHFDVFNCLVDTGFEFFYTIRMARNTALTTSPVTGWQIVQDHFQIVFFQFRSDISRWEIVWKQKFNAFEAILCSLFKAVHEWNLVEQHRQISSKFRHLKHP